MKWQTADPIEYELLKENAQKNRKHMTPAESAFWSLAKENGLGENCRRQYIIGCYIVDFIFKDSKLIVEIDGEYHQTEEQQQLDRIRQEYLEKLGYKILRFTNEQVLFEIEQVIDKINKEKEL